MVYHLAASADVFLSINNPERVLEINVLASVTLIRACQKMKVNKFVFASTSAVYGEPEYLPVNDCHKTNPISPYGLSKLNFEQYLKYFSSYSDINITIFRLPNVYGPRQRSDLEGGVVAIFYELMKKNLPVNIYGDGKQTRDWVYVSDIVDGFYRALELHEKFNLFLLGSNTETSLIDLFECLSDATSYKHTPNFVDARQGDIKNMVMDYDTAKSLLNWKPRLSLNEGINKLVNRV